LLGGMRALPSSDWGDDRETTPPVPGDWVDLGAVSHGFTHFELVLAVRGLRLAAKPALAGDWQNVDEMGDVGLPTVFRKAATLARATFKTSEAA
jgi:A/G-specific adenine glycosylase